MDIPALLNSGKNAEEFNWKYKVVRLGGPLEKLHYMISAKVRL